MKRGLKIFLALGFVGIASFALLVYYGLTSGTKVLGGFLEEVQRRSPGEVRQLLHPALLEEVDEGQFLRFLKAIPAEFGAFRRIRANGFEFKQRTSGGVYTERYEGHLEFGKEPATRTVHMVFGFRDHLLTHLRVVDQGAAQALLTRIQTPPEDPSPYRDSARRFFEAMFGGRPEEAWAAMSDPLQKALGRGTFDQQLAGFAEFGALAKVRVTGTEPVEGKADRLRVTCEITFEKRTVPAHVTYQFAGLGAYLIEFAARV